MPELFFEYSYNRTRIHGTYWSSCLAGIVSGKVGLNCELSTALLNQALLLKGENPFVLLVPNAKFDSDQPEIYDSHFISGTFSIDTSKLTVFDLYKKEVAFPQIFTLNVEKSELLPSFAKKQYQKIKVSNFDGRNLSTKDLLPIT